MLLTEVNKNNFCPVTSCRLRGFAIHTPFYLANLNNIHVTEFRVFFVMLKPFFFFCVFRILNLFAEENAVEDTIYYLSESLRKEAIDLDVFLKVTLQKLFDNCARER